MHTVQQLMTANPTVVGEDDTLAHCNQLISHHRIRHLPVVDSAGRLAGLVHDFDIQAGLAGTPRLAVRAFMGPCETTTADALAKDVLTQQLKTRQEAVVVVDADYRPVGIITEHDGLSLADVCITPWKTVGEVATRDALSVVERGDAVSTTLEFMGRQRVRHVLVVDGGRVCGVVSWRGLWSHGGHDHVGQVVADQTVHVARATTPLQSAVRLMIRENIGCLPLIDEGQAVGILTRSDVLEALVAQLVAASQ